MFDWGKWLRAFPFALEMKRCPDCGGMMEADRVHDKHTQEDPYGVEAWVCQECDRAEYKDEQ